MPEPSLGELQRMLFPLIRAADGVVPALRTGGLSRRRLAEVIVGDDLLGAVGRVGIYANMYFLRLQDALREAFPKLRAALGDEGFSGLCADYLEAHPSRHPSLRFLGDRLAAFLAGPGVARPRCPPLPVWAADLAALEWARYDLFDAADVPLLRLVDLQVMPPEAFATLPLHLAPGSRLLAVGHAVEQVWRTLHQQQQQPADIPARSGHLLLWRQDTFVYHRRIDEREAALLNDVCSGTQFGPLCERIATEAPDPAQAAFRLLARWARDGLLAAPPS
jgi:hypothetical protein